MDFFRAHKKLFFLNIIAVITFCFLAFFVEESKLRTVDVKTEEIAVIFRSEPLTNVMIAASSVFQPAVIFSLSFMLFIFLMSQKKRGYALLFLLTSFITIVTGLIFKKFFSLPRPINQLVPEIGSSFPSIHAAAAAVFFIVLAYAIEQKITDRVLEVLFTAVSLSMIVLIGISRVYLGVHWFSDVLAGFALGAFLGTAGIIIFKFLVEKRGM